MSTASFLRCACCEWGRCTPVSGKRPDEVIQPILTACYSLLSLLLATLATTRYSRYYSLLATTRYSLLPLLATLATTRYSLLPLLATLATTRYSLYSLLLATTRYSRRNAVRISIRSTAHSDSHGAPAAPRTRLSTLSEHRRVTACAACSLVRLRERLFERVGGNILQRHTANVKARSWMVG
jgi:hypothetical protein